MCWIDIVILVIIISLVIQGLIVGFVRSIFDLGGIVAGIFLALEYTERLEMPKWLAFLLIFLAVSIVVSIIGRLISKLIHLTPLGLMDRLMGGGLGFIKGLFFSFVFIVILFLFNKNNPLEKCEIAPLILKNSISACELLPEKWYKWLKKTIKRGEKVRPRACYESYNLYL